MKKLKTMVVLVVLCGGIAFAQNGVITGMSGTVELMKAGSSAFVPARTGDEVAMSTIVSTGFKSTALIKAGNTVITVRPLTRLSLAELSASAGTETLNVSLQTGRVQIDVNPPAGTRVTMTVRGPTATASVRGTTFIFDTRNISVQKGTVAFRGKRGPVMLIPAGSSSQTQEDNTVVDPLETNAAALLPPPPEGSSGGREQGRTVDAMVNFGFIIGYPAGP